MAPLLKTCSAKTFVKLVAVEPAVIIQATPQTLVLSGAWTATGLGRNDKAISAMPVSAARTQEADCAHIVALDTVGAWVFQRLLLRLRSEGCVVTLHALPEEFAGLMNTVAQQVSDQAAAAALPARPAPGLPERVGRSVTTAWSQALALLSFIGESVVALAGCVAHPERIRWRPILFNIRSAGFDALPIVGLLSFLLGVVVAYQSANQLRQFGANIFVVDLVGLSMLREFAPLMTAVIIAGRSGSAYAAQIGTMVVTEEIDAMRTLGIAPQELLVLPKLIALVIALPLLTVFADAFGVFGGMLMARAQLGVSFLEFFGRFAKAVSIDSYLTGLFKAPVFAVIIVMVGCFQGFRTHGGADSVGAHTTRSVVQSIFLVIVADAVFSVAFSVLDL